MISLSVKSLPNTITELNTIPQRFHYDIPIKELKPPTESFNELQ